MFHLFVCFLFVTHTLRWKVLKLAVPSLRQHWRFHSNWKWPKKFGERNWHDEWNLIWFISTDLSSKDDWSFVLGTLNYILISGSGKVCVSPTRQPEGGFLLNHRWSMLPDCPLHDYFMASYIVGAFFLHTQLDVFPPVMIKSNYCFFCHEKIFEMCILLGLW